MIQVYKKNELFIIENTVTDIIYPNLTREEALVLLKKFDRDEPEDRCDFAIKEDDISFEYASLDDKDKTIADLEAKLAESERKLEEYKKCNCKECMTDYEKNLNQTIDKYLNENIKLKQQLHDLPKKIVEEIRKEIEFPLYVHPDFDEFECLFDIDKLLDTILKKYGGKDESK